MVVLFQGSLAPYRVSLFNSLAEILDGELVVVLSREIPPPNRRWRIPWEDVRFRYIVLQSWRIDKSHGTIEISRRVGATLDRLQPDHVIVAGWDVHACWSALGWARHHPTVVTAWVESSERTGRHRGAAGNALRRLFLSSCQAAIVPGKAAESFVRSLAPTLPCYHAPNTLDSPELRTLGTPPRDGAAIFLGELSKRKGADTLLNAAEDLLSAFPTVIVAGDGPLRPQFHALAQRCSSFEYHGFVEPAARAELMGRASVALLPSRGDPWPLAACEALVARRPLVAGPGVGSVADLQAVAGDAVVAMEDQSPASLVSAAATARGRVVPPALARAFSPAAGATAIASAVRSPGIMRR